MKKMKHWTEDLLIKEGYKLENAKITNVELSMSDYGCLTLDIVLDGGGWGCVYGGYCLGKGYLGAKPDFFKGSAQGMESIMRIMDTVGVEKLSHLKGKYVRAATKGYGATTIKIIGNIISDKWFDYGTFFDKGEET